MSQEASITPHSRHGDGFRALHFLPWDTNATMSEMVPAELEGVLGKLESALKEREEIIKSSLVYDSNGRKTNISTVRQLLHHNMEEEAPSTFAAFAQQLCAYRIFDVANHLFSNQEESPLTVPQHGRQPFKIQRGFYRHMGDWTELAKKLLLHMQEKETLFSEQPITRESGPTSLSWDLLVQIHQEVRVEKLAAFKCNMLVAAFFLRHMLAGNLDLPDGMNDIYTQLTEGTSRNVPQDWPKPLEKTQGMRLPLQMALLISPLCLLMPVRLSKIDVSRDDLLVAWHCLGNTRPAVIKEVEKKIWLTLFSLATEQVNTETTIKKMIQDVAMISPHASVAEKFWLRSDSTIESKISFLQRPFNVLSCPVDWPNHTFLLERMRVQNNLIQNNLDTNSPNTRDEDSPGLDEDTVDHPSEEEDPDGGSFPDEPDEERQSSPSVKTTSKAMTHYNARSKSSRDKGSYGFSGRVTSVLKRKRTIPTNIIQENSHLLQDIKTIDLTNECVMPQHTLQLTESEAEPSPLAQVYKMFSELGATKSYKSPLPHENDQKFLNETVDMLQSFYINDEPPHWVKSKESVFYSVDNLSLEGRMSEDVQEVFQKQHIVILGLHQREEIEFNRRALESVGSWKKIITLQDLSIPIPEDGNHTCREFQGSLEDLWRHASSTNGRVITALDLPLLHAEAPDQRLASDMKAWSNTIELPFWDKSVQFPIHEMRWGLAATCGAQHVWKIYGQGVATTVEVKTGSQWWFVAKPKKGKSSILDIHDKENWTFNPYGKNADLWDIEAILLLPGMKLILRPNTPHMVVTTEHTVCHGNHFISSATLRATCYGVLHSFVQKHLHTNTQHRGVWYNLMRLLLFYREIYLDSYLQDEGKPLSVITVSLSDTNNELDLDKTHILDCDSIEGVHDLFTFLALMELGLALYPGSYDSEGIGGMDWARFSQVKNAVANILAWFKSNFTIKDEDDEETSGHYERVLLQISTLLIMYKEKSTKAKYGDKDVPMNDSTSRVLYEVAEVIAKHPEIDAIFPERFHYASMGSENSDGIFQGSTICRLEKGTFKNVPLDIDKERFHCIKAIIAMGEWPLPRITVEQFLDPRINEFPFRDHMDGDDRPENEEEEITNDLEDQVEQPPRKRVHWQDPEDDEE